jgi:hypothetical protein
MRQFSTRLAAALILAIVLGVFIAAAAPGADGSAPILARAWSGILGLPDVASGMPDVVSASLRVADEPRAHSGSSGPTSARQLPGRYPGCERRAWTERPDPVLRGRRGEPVRAQHEMGLGRPGSARRQHG